jgi:putative acetyltransferase
VIYAPGDETALRDVFHSSVHRLACQYYTTEQINGWAPTFDDVQEWAGRIASLRPFVVVVGGRIAGYADLQTSGYIDHFFIAGTCARQGVGSALMRHLQIVAESQRLERLAADVSLAAEAFFTSHGFRVETRNFVTIRGVQLPNARMSKPLPVSPSVGGQSLNPTERRGR